VLLNVGKKVLVLKKLGAPNVTQIDDIDSLNHPISPIPTLEDLKRGLFEPVYPELEFGYPSKVTGVEDIKSAAFLAQATTRTLCTPSWYPL
jgi:hypothetical protein